MKILVIKTSSLGDVIHTLPALSDAYAQDDKIRFDWVVEESLAEIPKWHPAVDQVIPIALRRWRKSPWRTIKSGEWKAFKRNIGIQHYDLVIDAQGLLKSAFILRYTNGPSIGYDRRSIREPLASTFYDRKIAVPRQLHAVDRVRSLFAKSIGYVSAKSAPNYGLTLGQAAEKPRCPYLFLLPGTTWSNKHWPEENWDVLISIALQNGYQIRVTWGTAAEKVRADKFAESNGVTVLPRMPLQELALQIAGAAGVVSVDTGLGHLAAALDRPCIALYGPTDPALSGIFGAAQTSLNSSYHCAPCLKRNCRYAPTGNTDTFIPPCWNTIRADVVWSALSAEMNV